jgi:hypothetical protein
MPDDLYERDFYAWAMREAGLLQRLARGDRVNDVLDAANLAEEIESLGRSEKRELSNRLRVLLLHLLKWQYQPERRGASWRATIRDQRYGIETVLEESPSLRPNFPDAIATAYNRTLPNASDETGLSRKTFPTTCPYTPEQILDHDFPPELSLDPT